MRWEQGEVERKYWAAVNAVESYLFSFDPDDVGGGEVYDLIDEVTDSVLEVGKLVAGIVEVA